MSQPTTSTAEDGFLRYRETPATVWIAGTLVGISAAVVLTLFHDRFWYPPDEGAYAHVARRILDGEVLNRDVQDIHLGAVNFINAAALALFGDRLVSLRYPLILLGTLSAMLAAGLLVGRGIVPACVAGLSVATLSIVQFLNPTAHWYCFFLFWATVSWLHWVPRESRRRLVGLGCLLGVMFQFRQLSGVLMAMGVLTCLIAEESSSEAKCRGIAGKTLCGVMGGGLLFYLLKKTDVVALLLYGVWPLVILVIVGRRATLSNRRMAALIVRLAAGFTVSLLPLIAYHLAHGSVESWLSDTVFVAEGLTRFDFFREISYPQLFAASVARMTRADGLDSVINPLFWMFAFAAGPLAGMLVVKRILGGQPNGLDRGRDFHSPSTFKPQPSTLLIPAVFYAVVSLHYQIPVYLFYTLSISITVLVFFATESPRWRIPALATIMLAGLTGLYFHAAQPLDRDLEGLLTGRRVPLVNGAGIKHLGLAIPESDTTVYRQLVDTIASETSPGDAIFALPANSELYYLTRRRNPVRFYNSGLGIGSKRQCRDVISRLSTDRPVLVFYRPEDKYNNEYSQAVMQFVRRHYVRAEDIGPFQVYRLRKRPGG